MPKIHTFPTLYDEVKTVSIRKLKEWGYLEKGSYKTGTISWSRNGFKHSSIGIAVNMLSEQPYIEFSYKCNDKSINYKVYFVTTASNIGKGEVWYFLCPNTSKRCRILYMADTYFLHRSAFRGCMYEKQTYSKNTREQFRLWGKLFGTDKIYEQIYSKYFKKQYAGKPTKKYLKLLEELRQTDKISEQDLIAWSKT